MTQAYVALLRGINVGGKHKLPMAELRALFEAAGCAEVATYIQSGNVVFHAPADVARELPVAVAGRIRRRFGFEVPVVVRSAKELAALAAGNPFLARGAPPEELHVMFLAGRPPAAKVRALDPERSPGDAFEVRGREVFLHLPDGVARSKLTNAWIDARPGTVSTTRNWRTVRKLLELVR